MFEIIITPFAFLLRLFYNMSNSYLFALLIFTIILRLVMVPSSIGSQKMMAKNLFFSAKQKKLQEKYKNDREKLNKAQQELMLSEGNNPLSGCLPMALPLIILLPVYQIIYKPLTHIAQIDKATITKATDAISKIFEAAKQKASSHPEFDIIENIDKISSQMGAGFTESVKGISEHFTIFGQSLIEKPSFSHFSILWLIPILAAVTSFVYSKVTTNMSQAVTGQQNPMGGGMMLLMMPLMSLWMCFNFPAGLGIYWMFSNVIGLFIQVFINRLYNPLAINSKSELTRRIQRIEREKKIKEAKSL